MPGRRRPQMPKEGKPMSEKQAKKHMGELMHQKVVRTGKLPKTKPY